MDLQDRIAKLRSRISDAAYVECRETILDRINVLENKCFKHGQKEFKRILSSIQFNSDQFKRLIVGKSECLETEVKGEVEKDMETLGKCISHVIE